MNKNNLIRFLGSFVLLPVATASMPLGNITKDNSISQFPQAVLSLQPNIEANSLFAFNQVEDEKAKDLSAKALAIDTYFKEHDMPLEGMGKKMVEEAEKNGIDWNLVAAISVRESTGGIHACIGATHSFLGWGSCKINFKSDEEAIEVVSSNLGGNDPDTDQHYANTTTYEKLRKYNSYIKRYPEQVMKIMDDIQANLVEEIPKNENQTLTKINNV